MLDTTSNLKAVTRSRFPGNLGGRLRALRKSHRHTQHAVAERLGISPQAVCQWESGKTRPTLDKLVSIAQRYNVSLNELLKEPPPPSITDIVAGLKSMSDVELATVGKEVGVTRLWDGAIAPNIT